MARTHPHTIDWPTSLWDGIEAEALRLKMTPKYYIVTTMDAAIRKAQEDYSR